MSRSKHHLNVAVIGSQGSGKSTLCGHLLFQCGTLDSRSIENRRDEIKSTRSLSMNEFSLMVNLSQSKSQHGMTVENTIHRLETPNFVCTLVDTPGNEREKKTLSAALGQADVAILVVDSTADDIECTEVSDERFGYLNVAQIAHDQGIRQMIVVLTKVDEHVSDFSKKQFHSLVENVGSSLGKIGFESSTIPFIPISGLKGDNLTHRSPNIPWYDGSYLTQALDEVESPIRESFRPLWLPILSVCHVEKIGTVAIGTIEAGTLNVGMQLKILPNDIIAKVESIEMHHSALSTAQAGDHIGFNLVVSDNGGADVRSGCIATDPDVSYSTLVDHGYL